MYEMRLRFYIRFEDWLLVAAILVVGILMYK